MEMNNTKAKLNEAVNALAKIDRPAAVAILAKFGVLTTASLPTELWQPVLEAFEEARSKIAEGAP